MSSIDATNAAGADWAQGEQDLGPLAWVLDELRKSLDSANKAMRRFVRDAEQARESDLAALDASPLRMARQQLHQASGALDMVGQAAPTLVLRAMEAAVQKFVQRPDQCSEQAAAVIERASFALIEYLESVLTGKQASPVALFPQYRDTQALVGAERVHPADLWPAERRLREPVMGIEAAPLPYGTEARARLDSAVLRVVKSADPVAAAALRDTCLGFVAAQQEPAVRTFWKLSAAFFDAVAARLLPPDVYVKRVASRVLLQYATYAKGDQALPDRLVQDLLFFCAQAQPSAGAATGPLQAVRAAFQLDRFAPVDYETARFGRFDPALLAQARKRIAAATETWSALAGGDRVKLKPAVDQFSLVCDSLLKLLPGSDSLARALTRTLDSTARSGEPPSPALAMEVATSVLYLQATFDDLDASDANIVARSNRLSERLEQVLGGAEPEPLEHWMEELYRRVSDRQTMGSVVDELRATLADAEKCMDQFFRAPDDLTVLVTVPGQLAQMRGVLSVLGLEQAAHAVAHMRATVERLVVNEVPESDRQGLFEKLGSNLGALGFLIDMLGYQRAMARKLFIYDEEQGELRILMGRARPRVGEEAPQAAPPLEIRAELPLPEVIPRTTVPTTAIEEPQAPAVVLAEPSTPVPAPAMAAQAPAPVPTIVEREVDDELLDIFLEEAREVVQTGLAALDALAPAPGDLSEQTTLRRAFHTLKGSSRMVGLNDFGEAGWALEQMLNAWLAEQKPMPEAMQALARQALQGFGQWAEAIAQGQADAWQAAPFRQAADAMRLRGETLPLDMPTAAPAAALAAAPASAEETAAVETAAVAEVAPQPEPEPVFAVEPEPLDFAPTQTAPELEVQAPEPEPEPVAVDILLPEDAQEIDFSVFAAEAAAPAEVALPEPMPEVVAPVEAPLLDLELAPAPVDEASLATPAVAESPADLPPADWPQDFVLEDVPELAFDVDTPAQAAIESIAEPEPELEPTPILEPVAAVEPELLPEVADVPELPALDLAEFLDAPTELPQAEEAGEEQYKQIGSLRLGVALYNVYVNEADEWSRRLDDVLQDWAQQPHESLPDTAVALAHSLAGSSATVGFVDLSELARLLEHALQHVQLQSAALPTQVQTFLAAAEEIRRLLHQFAAGFLKAPAPALLEALGEILHTEISSGMGTLDANDEAPASLPEFEPAALVLPELAPTPEPEPEPVLAPEPAPLEFVAPEEPEPVMPTVPQVAASVSEFDFEQQVDDAIAQAVAHGSDFDDDIDALDVIDADLFPIFEEEAIELFPSLGASLRQWAVHPQDMAARSLVLRALHTLKGSSRLAGAMRLGEMAHRLETAVENVGTEDLSTDKIEPLLAGLDGLQASFEVLRHVGGQGVEGLPSAPEVRQSAATLVAAAPAPGVPAAAAAPLRLPAAPLPVPQRAAAGHSVRVRSQLLDRLVNQAGEVLIARSRLDARMKQFKGSLDDLSSNLERLRQQLRDIELQAESQMQSRLALSKDHAAGFDPLEFDRFTRVQELTRMMAESVNDVATVQRNLQRSLDGAEDDLIAQGRQARDLQRDLLRTRMVEFDAIAERLYAVVRQSSKELGKHIKLDIDGGTIELDRGVLDRMTPAFEHLLRNCVSHGIEMPEQRVAQGKVATGTITVALRHEGNDVAVEFRDDGAGLNLARIREKAIAQGLITADAQLSNADAAQLIFMPGFSTATEVTGLSGRGIGMDVVRSEVNALGGRIETETVSGQGSTFRMVLPLTTAVTQVVMLRCGDLAIGVPANLVEIVRRTSVTELEQAYRSGEFRDGQGSVPFFWAGALLQSSPRSLETAGKTRPVVILRSAAQRLAMHVDEVLGNQEIVVKNLGPQLSSLPGLAGMSVLASGAVVLVYNPVALATVYGDAVRAQGRLLPVALEAEPVAGATQPQQPASGKPVAPQVPLVLVVDDSITVRRVTQRLLQREGYRVALAADGLQALERLQEERPTVVLSDIEMPRMDGFDLARNIRGDAALHDLPIVMITSRIAEKHREHAMELGVNHYLGKPYSDEELLGLVKHYAAKAAELAQA
ncbi:response regulator [Acidovorax sp. HDW3]|uniref:Hpt domain-containing protein n=1 Tax=Acidovorax sp. HDW3 TaxID=2714923 RepID=UPI00140E9302|nr:Hpt domain-containing protein [Acidovorax sp. HDW3]QIL44752.1 response regulator [Acidovorax sp. HDW3]